MRDLQFDLITRALSSSASRRGALGLLTSAAGLLAFDAADAREGKHRKRHKKRSKRSKRRKHGGGSQSGSVCSRAGSRTCDPAQAGAGQDLRQCDLSSGALVWTGLSGSNATQADLTGAHLLGAQLEAMDLFEACLAEATLRNASLRGSTLKDADLSGADLCGADLRGTRVTEAQLASASVCCSTLRSDGSSAAPCSQGRTCCGDGCSDLTSSSANCGACGKTCAEDQVCCEGTCVVPGVGQRCSTPDPVCIPPSQDLQKVLDDAPANATIWLCSGTWELENTLLVSKDVTIIGSVDGNSSILDGGGNIQVVGIRPKVTVEIEAVTITRGQADEGAGIFNQGYLTLYSCQVTKNSARLGGGLYNEGTVRVYYGAFANNDVLQGSDPFFDPDYRGGAIYNDEGTVDLYGAVFSDNTANEDLTDAGEGGAIFNYYGQVTLHSGTQLTNNHAEAWGGGIYNEGGKLTVEAGSSVTTNAAGYSGGGVYADGGASNIAAGTVTGNNPDNCYGSLTTNCT